MVRLTPRRGSLLKCIELRTCVSMIHVQYSMYIQYANNTLVQLILQDIIHVLCRALNGMR